MSNRTMDRPIGSACWIPRGEQAAFLIVKEGRHAQRVFTRSVESVKQDDMRKAIEIAQPGDIGGIHFHLARRG